jgi:hypothetical protein
MKPSAIIDGCLQASVARDDWRAEFIELKVTHREFEAAVSEHLATCR